MSDVRGFQFGEFTPITPVDLPKGITRASLMEMRGTGMSNKGIADALGIAPWRVAKVIGDTPKEIRAKISRQTAKKARAAKAAKQEQEKAKEAQEAKQSAPKSSLVRVSAIFSLRGKVATYRVDTGNKCVSIEKIEQAGNSAAKMALTFKECEAFALELMDVLGEVDQ